MNESKAWAAVALIVIITAATRFLPFILWDGKRKPPKAIERLGKILPYAVMGMLLVYCLKDVSFDGIAGFLPEVIACALVVVLHCLKRNTLLSIVCGTVCYMLLCQKVF